MKVVHINTYEGNGGAGRACLRLNEALNAKDIDSTIIVFVQFKKSTKTKQYSSSYFQKAWTIFHILAERYLSKILTKGFKVPFSIQLFGRSILQNAEVKNADIIHLHWVNHGFLSPHFIAELKKLNKPVVWTFHDNNPFTGGCHVRYACTGYLHKCGNCHLVRFSGPKDFSHQTWKAKKKAYTSFNFTVIAPSTWMGQSAANAALTKGKSISVIPNALETEIFRPMDRTRCRAELTIDVDAYIILAGYMPSSRDRHKGLKELQETLHHLANCSSIATDRILLMFYGSSGQEVNLNIPVKYRFMGKITDDELLVKLYNAADVFLFPSIEESMGYTALESLSCGTPVAGFATSGVTDVVIHGKNGYLAPVYDTKQLAIGIAWILKEGKGSALAENARRHAVSQFSMDVVAQKHIDLYKHKIVASDQLNG